MKRINQHNFKSISLLVAGVCLASFFIYQQYQQQKTVKIGTENNGHAANKRDQRFMREEFDFQNQMQSLYGSIGVEDMENDIERFHQAIQAIQGSAVTSQAPPTGFIYQQLYSGAQCTGNLTYSYGFAAGVCLPLYDEVTGVVKGSIYGNCTFSNGLPVVQTNQYSSSNCNPRTKTMTNSTSTGSCLGVSGNQYGVSYRNFCQQGSGVPVRMNSAVTFGFSNSTYNCTYNATHSKAYPISFSAIAINQCFISTTGATKYTCPAGYSNSEPDQYIYQGARNCSVKATTKIKILNSCNQIAGASSQAGTTLDYYQDTACVIQTAAPSPRPTPAPTVRPGNPTARPSPAPTTPTVSPSPRPTASPTAPSAPPSPRPSYTPGSPTPLPSTSPSSGPSSTPTAPTPAPSSGPTARPTPSPSSRPSPQPTTPTAIPTPSPTYLPGAPTPSPSLIPTPIPSLRPSSKPSTTPTFQPTAIPTTAAPTALPSTRPTRQPTAVPTTPTASPTFAPTYLPGEPTPSPTIIPSPQPSTPPSTRPTRRPSAVPTTNPSPAPTTAKPTARPSTRPTRQPTAVPSTPTMQPTSVPSTPTAKPTSKPSAMPTSVPSAPTNVPSPLPSSCPTAYPTPFPTVSSASYGYFYVSQLVSGQGMSVQAWNLQPTSNLTMILAVAAVISSEGSPISITGLSSASALPAATSAAAAAAFGAIPAAEESSFRSVAAAMPQPLLPQEAGRRLQSTPTTTPTITVNYKISVSSTTQYNAYSSALYASVQSGFFTSQLQNTAKAEGCALLVTATSSGIAVAPLQTASAPVSAPTASPALSGGAIAGIVIAVLLVCGGLSGCGYYFYIQNKEKVLDFEFWVRQSESEGTAVQVQNPAWGRGAQQDNNGGGGGLPSATPVPADRQGSTEMEMQPQSPKRLSVEVGMAVYPEDSAGVQSPMQNRSRPASLEENARSGAAGGGGSGNSMEGVNPMRRP